MYKIPLSGYGMTLKSQLPVNMYVVGPIVKISNSLTVYSLVMADNEL